MTGAAALIGLGGVAYSLNHGTLFSAITPWLTDRFTYLTFESAHDTRAARIVRIIQKDVNSFDTFDRFIDLYCIRTSPSCCVVDFVWTVGLLRRWRMARLLDAQHGHPARMPKHSDWQHAHLRMRNYLFGIPRTSHRMDVRRRSPSHCPSGKTKNHSKSHSLPSTLSSLI